jgi:L-amino acid N-acyltransferase YncA
MDFLIDPLVPADWQEVRAIYLEGIATGQATFETEAPSWEEWDGGHLRECRLAAGLPGRLIGWAALCPVSRRRCYAGVAEVSVYVATPYHGQGVGKGLLQTLVADSERHGIWTLQGATFAENAASLRLQASCGFRMVGQRERIGQLHGAWRTTVLMERRSSIVGTDAPTSGRNDHTPDAHGTDGHRYQRH